MKMATRGSEDSEGGGMTSALGVQTLWLSTLLALLFLV